MAKDKAQGEDAFVAFIKALIPERTRELFTVLAQLDIPIPDAWTYAKAIDAATDEAQVETRELLKAALKPNAFPILSRQSAFEKLNEALAVELRLMPLAGPWTLQPPALPPLLSRRERYSPREQETLRRLIRWFECREACENDPVYLDYVATGQDPQAQKRLENCYRTCSGKPVIFP
jgi:hypothetical protein